MTTKKLYTEKKCGKMGSTQKNSAFEQLSSVSEEYQRKSAFGDDLFETGKLEGSVKPGGFSEIPLIPGEMHCLLFAICYGSAATLSEFTQSGDQKVPAMQALLVRAVVCTLGIVLAAALSKERRDDLKMSVKLLLPSNNDKWSVYVLSLAMPLLSGMFIMFAVESMSSGDTIVIVEICGVTAGLIACRFLFNERMHYAQIMGAIVAICGAILVIRPPFIFGSSGVFSLIGLMWALATTVSFVIAEISTRYSRGIDPRVIASIRLLLYLPLYSILLVCALPITQVWIPIEDMSPQKIVAMLGLGVVHFFEIVELNYAIALAPFYLFAVMGPMAMVVAFVTQILLLDEVESAFSYMGLSLVICSMVVIFYYQQKDKDNEWEEVVDFVPETFPRK